MAGSDAAALMESVKEYLEPVTKMAIDVKDKVGFKQIAFSLSPPGGIERPHISRLFSEMRRRRDDTTTSLIV